MNGTLSVVGGREVMPGSQETHPSHISSPVIYLLLFRDFSIVFNDIFVDMKHDLCIVWCETIQ